MIKNKCIIFDFDGVIVDSFDASYKISKVALNVNNKSEFRGLFKGNIANTIKNKLSPSGFTSFFNRYKSALSTMPIVPGIKEVIQKVSKGYLLAIASSTTSGSINNFLKFHHLEKYFSEILGIDHSTSKEEKIRYILQAYGLTAKDCLMITDTVGDIEEAKHVGVMTIGVTWGYHDEGTLKAVGPYGLARTPHELIQLIQNYLSKQ